VGLSVIMDDDGSLRFVDDNGNPASEEAIAAAKAQKSDDLRVLMQRGVDEVNAKTEALGQIHIYTPSPDSRPQFEPTPFSVPEPERPEIKQPGLMDKMLSGRRQVIEDANRAAQASHESARAAWSQAKGDHEVAESRRKTLIEQLIYRSPTAMEIYLETVLQDIVWPRETSVTLEVSDDLQRIQIAVDLPEIEDLPRRVATLPARGYKATIKEMSDGKLRKLYMAHVHGVGFRIIGEAFAALPTVREVVLSSFSQRPDPRTGQNRDDYLYSVRVERPKWQEINFKALKAIDLVEAFTVFDLRRDMSKTGIFKSIEPLAF